MVAPETRRPRKSASAARRLPAPPRSLRAPLSPPPSRLLLLWAGALRWRRRAGTGRRGAGGVACMRAWPVCGRGPACGRGRCTCRARAQGRGQGSRWVPLRRRPRCCPAPSPRWGASCHLLPFKEVGRPSSPSLGIGYPSRPLCCAWETRLLPATIFPIFISSVAGIIGMNHHAWPQMKILVLSAAFPVAEPSPLPDFYLTKPYFMNSSKKLAGQLCLSPPHVDRTSLSSISKDAKTLGSSRGQGGRQEKKDRVLISVMAVMKLMWQGPLGSNMVLPYGNENFLMDLILTETL
ncbi:uncharacterized protein [Dipodomys merriami]|uniref:uncharacterized protein n=1 Tax=Dipodomys merriami TaxID=94247 RepID=UPI003855B450